MGTPLLPSVNGPLIEGVEPGHVLGGKYRLISPLGEGAMGTVWLARHQALNSDVAVKVIRSGGNDPIARQRLFTEARATVAINSQHVVKVFDYGVEDEQPYIVMERLIGETLDQRLKLGGSMTPELLDEVVFQLARGLGKAHEMGLIHRDLKPANIFLAGNADEMVVKMLDFGIVKYQGGTQLEIEATHSRELMGSPLYMSPEQVLAGQAVDHRSDLWSLGVIAFACVTGRWPFRGANSAETLVKICQDEPDLTGLDRYPPALEDWARRAFRKAPDERFQSARELAAAFRLALLGEVDEPRNSQSDTQPLAPSSRPPNDRETHAALSASQPPALARNLTQNWNGWIAVIALALGLFAVFQEWRWWAWRQSPPVSAAAASARPPEPAEPQLVQPAPVAVVAAPVASPTPPAAESESVPSTAGSRNVTRRAAQPKAKSTPGAIEANPEEQLLRSRH